MDLSKLGSCFGKERDGKHRTSNNEHRTLNAEGARAEIPSVLPTRQARRLSHYQNRTSANDEIRMTNDEAKEKGGNRRIEGVFHHS